MKRSNAVMSFNKYREMQPVITKIGVPNDMSRVISLALQKPIKDPVYKINGLNYR